MLLPLVSVPVLETPFWLVGMFLALGGLTVLVAWFFGLYSQVRRREALLHAQVTEREAEARQSALALAATRKELEAFLYTVSHDLRAPLRATCGFSELLQRRYADRLDDEGRRHLDNVIEASRYMDRLLHDLLAYSRVGQMTVVLQLVDLNGIVNRVLQVLREQLEATGATVQMPPSLPSVVGHPGLLEQVFLKLFDNALTYRQAWEPPRLVLWAAEDGAHLLLHLQDNGIGIAPAYHEKIFEVFQRLHHREAYPGTGIGLALVRKAVEQMQGTVWVTSAPGQGSTFTVRLWRSQASSFGANP